MKEFYLINTIAVQRDRVANIGDLVVCDDGETWEHGLTGFLLADASGIGCVMAIAFAKHLQDALDIAADADLLLRIKADDDFDPEDRYASLGNDGDRYNLDNLVAIEFDASKGMEVYLSHD